MSISDALKEKEKAKEKDNEVIKSFGSILTLTLTLTLILGDREIREPRRWNNYESNEASGGF